MILPATEIRLGQETTSLIATLPTQYSIEVVYPATRDKHYLKYSRRQKKLQMETPWDYSKKNLSRQLQYNDWVYKILEGKNEQENVLFRDDHPQMGFILLRDSSWVGEKQEQLHILGMPLNRELHSIRDLTGRHVSLLQTIQQRARDVITKQYGLESYREVFHYPPAFWHLHVHFQSI